MLKFKTIVSVTAGALAVMGCASPRQEQLAGPYLRPMQTVHHGGNPEALYRTGRYFQDQNRDEQAIDAYRQALAADPSHADAHNALGVIHSLQNRSELAEQEFRAALDIASDAVRVHNNLGYHLMVNGRVEEALASFERARALEPQNATVAANMVAAQKKLGLPAEVQRPVPAQDQTVAQQAASARAPVPTLVPVATMRFVHLSGNVWELRSASPARPSIAPAGRVEIANGNGATGLALRISHLLAPRSIRRLWPNNEKPYGAVTSRIQFVAGAERVAREISLSLPMSLRLERTMRALPGQRSPPQVLSAETGAQAPIKLALARPSNGH